MDNFSVTISKAKFDTFKQQLVAAKELTLVNDMSGTIDYKGVNLGLSATDNGNGFISVTIDIVKKPFFISENMIQDFVKNSLQN